MSYWSAAKLLAKKKLPASIKFKMVMLIFWGRWHFNCSKMGVLGHGVLDDVCSSICDEYVLDSDMQENQIRVALRKIPMGTIKRFGNKTLIASSNWTSALFYLELSKAQDRGQAERDAILWAKAMTVSHVLQRKGHYYAGLCECVLRWEVAFLLSFC